MECKKKFRELKAKDKEIQSKLSLAKSQPLKHKLSESLSSALNKRQTSMSSSCTIIKQTKSKGNPAKRILESHGVNFPSSKTILAKSSIYCCAPDNEDGEQEQLDMVIKLSMLDYPETCTEVRPTVIYQPVLLPAVSLIAIHHYPVLPFFSHSVGEQSLSISHDQLPGTCLQ